MAVTKADEQNITEKGQSIGLSVDQLAYLIKEIKKPYVDEAEVAQTEINREAERARIAGEQEYKRRVKIKCRHKRKDGTYNLNGQRNCNGDYLIICGECTGAFLPGDPQYQDLLEVADLERFGNARQLK